MALDLVAPAAVPRGVSTGLLTDHYELTMLETALHSGVAHHRAVFEVFTRRLPPGRRYGVVAGTGRLLEALAEFQFGPEELDWLRDHGVVSPATLDWLAGYRFSGTISGYREGELFTAGSPILTVDAPFGEAILLETLVLSVLNHDSAIAAAGARMVVAAGGRMLIEAGGRRTHEWAAPAAARAAYLVGFAATSNLEAGRRFGVPTGGTAAHALVLAHADERRAFRAQLDTAGPGTTLLVDTYDVAGGIANAVATAGPGLAGVRIDSGDLAEAARRARVQLDALGAREARIVISGDLDEWQIAALQDAPVDRMLVGTQLVVGSGAPTAGLVYKLVAIAGDAGLDAPLRPVAKFSPGKATRGGRKVAYRGYDDAGWAATELLMTTGRPPGGGYGETRALQTTFVRAGEVDLGALRLGAARTHHARCRSELPPRALALDAGEPALRTVEVA
jgi:nicotinate phosphoribosyltransferase